MFTRARLGDGNRPVQGRGSQVLEELVCGIFQATIGFGADQQVGLFAGLTTPEIKQLEHIRFAVSHADHLGMGKQRRNFHRLGEALNPAIGFLLFNRSLPVFTLGRLRSIAVQFHQTEGQPFLA